MKRQQQDIAAQAAATADRVSSEEQLEEPVKEHLADVTGKQAGAANPLSVRAELQGQASEQRWSIAGTDEDIGELESTLKQAFSPDGQSIGYGSSNRTLGTWHLAGV